MYEDLIKFKFMSPLNFLLLAVLAILSQFYSTPVAAQTFIDFVSPEYLQAIYECHVCDPKKSLFIENKKVTCQAELKLDDCQGLGQKYPELKNNIKSCDATAICQETLFQNEMKSFGCFDGFKDTLYDIVSIYTALQNGLKMKDLHKECLALPECATELTKFEVQFIAETNKIKTSLSQMNDLKSLRSHHTAKVINMSYPNSPYFIYKKFFPTHFALPELPSKKQIQNLLSETLDKQYRSLQCFTPKTRAQLQCYWFFSVVDPIAALKILKANKALNVLLKATLKDHRVQNILGMENKIASNATTKAIARNPHRQKFVDTYLHVESSTFAEREEFISLLKAPKSRNRIFFEFENSKLKTLNDTMKDKDFITAINNMAKEKMYDKLSLLAKSSQPPLKVYKYSDGKSLTLGIEGKITPELQNEINKLFVATNNETSRYLLQNNLIRATDAPQEWFRAGIGSSIDEANLAARFSRGTAQGENRAYVYSQEQVRENLESVYKFSKLYSEELNQAPSLSRFMENVTTPNGVTRIPNLELFENLRKYPEVSEFQKVMELKYNLKIPEDTAQKALDYAKLIDDLNPKVLVADQRVVTLENATEGGMTMDRKGMGAMNQEATALAIAKSDDFDNFIIANRHEEQIVTELIEKERQEFKKLTGGDSRGDDSVLAKKLSLADKRTILKSSYAQNRRIAFIPEGIADPAARLQLATHGEGLEKILTDQVLLGKIPYEKIKEIRFAVDMQTTQLGSGKVDLLMQPERTISLTPTERKIIKDSFREAIEIFNKKQKELNLTSQYHN